MSFTVKFTTATKSWESRQFDSLEEAEGHRKFGFARWHAKGTVCHNGVALSSPGKASPTVDVHRLLILKAHQAGVDAAEACTPVPMIVSQHENPLDDSSPVIKQYEPVSGGVCGFAWVVIKPANCRVAKLAAELYRATKSEYEGGMRMWVNDYGQSMERKEAYARAFAKVLSEAGVRCYSQSRMD